MKPKGSLGKKYELLIDNIVEYLSDTENRTANNIFETMKRGYPTLTYQTTDRYLKTAEERGLLKSLRIGKYTIWNKA